MAFGRKFGISIKILNTRFDPAIPLMGIINTSIKLCIIHYSIVYNSKGLGKTEVSHQQRRF